MKTSLLSVMLAVTLILGGASIVDAKRNRTTTPVVTTTLVPQGLASDVCPSGDWQIVSDKYWWQVFCTTQIIDDTGAPNTMTTVKTLPYGECNIQGVVRKCWYSPELDKVQLVP